MSDNENTPEEEIFDPKPEGDAEPEKVEQAPEPEKEEKPKEPVEMDWSGVIFQPKEPSDNYGPVVIYDKDGKPLDDEVVTEKFKVTPEDTQPAEELSDINKRYDILQKSSTQLPEDSFNYTLDDAVEPPYNLDQLVNLNEVSVIRNSCILAIATNTVGLGYQIRKDDPLDPLTKTDEISKKIRKQLERWASRGGLTFKELMFAVKYDEETTGNGYIEVSRNRRGEIDGLYHIPAHTMRVRKNRDGFIQERGFTKKVGFYNFGDKVKVLSDGRIEYLPDRDPKVNEIIHFKLYNSKSLYYGLPHDIPAIVTIAGDEMARNHNLKYFTHSATPDFFLVFEMNQSVIEKAHGNQPVNVEVPEQVKQEVVQHFRQNLASQQFLPGVFAMPNGVTLRLERVSQGQKDAGWTNYREENRKEVQLAHRVPDSILGLSGSNYAASAVEKANFLEQVIKPEQIRYTERLMGLLWPELVMIKPDQVPAQIDEAGQMTIPAQPKLSDSDDTSGIDQDVWKLEFVQLTSLSKVEQAQVHNIYKQIGAIDNDEIRDDLGLKPNKSPMEVKEEEKAPTPAETNPDQSDPNDIRGLQGLPGGGRSENGKISIPALKRPNSDSIPVPANINTYGRPGSIAKRSDDLVSQEEMEDVLANALEEGFKQAIKSLSENSED